MREGRRFGHIAREIEKSQFLTASDLATWQEARLWQLLSHAVAHVPFYRELGLAKIVADATPTDALSAFPIIDKATVRNNGARFLADNAPRLLVKGHTSGTTGSPLVVHQDLTAITRESAFIWRQLNWAGLERGRRRAWIRGDLIVPAETNSPPFWRKNLADNMWMFSSYHLSVDNASAYIEALEAFDPVIIQAYPSSIGFLANWLRNQGDRYHGRSLKGIVTSSETLSTEQQALIEARFGCRVFDWYGQFERVAAIGTCEWGRRHVISDYSFVEFLPADNGLLEVVGTTFNNFVMPFIRYRTYDYIGLADESEYCECHRHFPLVNLVHGRADDVVKLLDGRHIGRLDHIFKNIPGILEAQIRQERPDCIEILVVSTSGYGPAAEKQLCDNAREHLGSGVDVRVLTVTSIPRTQDGKLRGVVCNV